MEMKSKDMPESWEFFPLATKGLFLLCLTHLLGSFDLRAFDKQGYQTLLQKHCIECHGLNGKVKGKVDLLPYAQGGDIRKDEELLQMVMEVIDFGEMPPEEKDPIPEPEREQLVLDLKQLLREAVQEAAETPRAPIRRMTRLQYANAVEDLLELKVVLYPLPERMMRDRSGYFKPETGRMPDKMTVSSRPLGKSGLIEPRMDGLAPFPQDLRAEHGYDTQGDHLSLSPLLMEDFFRLGRSIVQSPSFTPKNVGTWGEYFADLPANGDAKIEVRKRLSDLLTHAFRRPVDDSTLGKYLAYAEGALDRGSSLAEVMKESLSAILASPRFLYLYDLEREEEADSVRALNFDLASRLSFFLWGSLPDRELLDLADSGQLVEGEILSRQVERMLKDRKLKRFCDSFPTQWLQLDRIISAVPDEKKYRDFYYAAPLYRTTMDMMMEPLLLFETVLIEDRSVLELIDSNYTFRSPRLRKWYGEDPKGKLGGPVSIPFARQFVEDRRHGGVITNGAVMTMTSGPLETKPITRGAWIAGVIFNSPPPPPPAEVPPLPEEKEFDENLTLRERFSEHRERADCAGCHEKLDPLGFALENFDPVGRWREKYHNGRKVDSSGTLFRTHEFSNIIEFKDAILKEKDRFIRSLAGHLLAFALGRELAPSDSLALDQIVETVTEEDFRMKALIHAVIQSRPFRGTSAKLALRQAH